MSQNKSTYETYRAGLICLYHTTMATNNYEEKLSNSANNNNIFQNMDNKTNFVVHNDVNISSTQLKYWHNKYVVIF